MTSSPLPYASKVGDSRPAAGLTDHSGREPVKEYDFFAPPPAEIGQLWSAESTLLIGKDPLPPAVKWVVAAVIAGAVFVCGVLLYTSTGSRDGSVLMFTLVLTAGTFALVLYQMRFEPRCSYVGAAGVARFIGGGSREIKKASVLLFDQAETLQTSQVRNSVNGIYTGTNYNYHWTDAQGRSLLRLKGSYRAARGKAPKPGHAFNFCRAAELAWSNFYLGRAQQALREEGAIPFRVDRNRWLRVGPGFMEFHFGGEPVRVEKTDIAKVTLGNGIFRFQHKDASWLSRSGKFSFSYGGMGNARVFLLALDKLMGYRWD